MLHREMKGEGGRALQLESQLWQGHKKGALGRGEQHLSVAGVLLPRAPTPRSSKGAAS